MSSELYLAKLEVQTALEAAKSYKRNFALSLWVHILDTEFPREDGTWFISYRLHPRIVSYRLVPQWRRWTHSPGVVATRCYLLVIIWPYTSYEFGKHRKFGDDAREAILLVMTLSPGADIGEHHITIAAVSEMAVEFWEWTGRENGRPDLKRLVVEDQDEERKISGPLHVVDDAEKVHKMLRHVRERAESMVDTDGIAWS
ncbi:hypothetical protein TWF173_009063 [Orbilia oligospora]|nr:hypothetical protein TWF173_009063 [Orbilia oligospora]